MISFPVVVLTLKHTKIILALHTKNTFLSLDGVAIDFFQKLDKIQILTL